MRLSDIFRQQYQMVLLLRGKRQTSGCLKYKKIQKKKIKKKEQENVGNHSLKIT